MSISRGSWAIRLRAPGWRRPADHRAPVPSAAGGSDGRREEAGSRKQGRNEALYEKTFRSSPVSRFLPPPLCADSSGRRATRLFRARPARSRSRMPINQHPAVSLSVAERRPWIAKRRGLPGRFPRRARSGGGRDGEGEPPVFASSWAVSPTFGYAGSPCATRTSLRRDLLWALLGRRARRGRQSHGHARDAYLEQRRIGHAAPVPPHAVELHDRCSGNLFPGDQLHAVAALTARRQEAGGRRQWKDGARGVRPRAPRLFQPFRSSPASCLQPPVSSPSQQFHRLLQVLHEHRLGHGA